MRRLKGGTDHEHWAGAAVRRRFDIFDDEFRPRMWAKAPREEHPLGVHLGTGRERARVRHRGRIHGDDEFPRR